MSFHRSAGTDQPGLYLQPGELAVCGRDRRVTTILGSCVAVCLHDPVSGVGGINHYVLPRGPREPESARFGDVALRRLLAESLSAGAVRERLEAKVFGGASVLGADRALALGNANVAFALAFLQAEGIRVVARDTGGARGRKLVFHTGDGAAWVRTL